MVRVALDAWVRPSHVSAVIPHDSKDPRIRVILQGEEYFTIPIDHANLFLPYERSVIDLIRITVDRVDRKIGWDKCEP